MTLVDNLPVGEWYFHLAARDLCGNRGDVKHYGPVVVHAPESYASCTTTANSTGLPAAIWYEGSLSITANDLVLRCSNLPQNPSCNFYYGPNEVEVAFGTATAA